VQIFWREKQSVVADFIEKRAPEPKSPWKQWWIPLMETSTV